VLYGSTRRCVTLRFSLIHREKAPLALVDLTTAAKLAGISRQTIYRRMADGTISWELDKNGRRCLDTSEIIRVFGPLNSHDENLTSVTSDTVRQDLRKDEDPLEGYLIAIEALKAQVQSERERASRAEADADFLRQSLAKAQDQATKLLTDQSRVADRPSPWWRFWSARKD